MEANHAARVEKSIIITGGAGGIGSATALLAAKRGYNVAIGIAGEHERDTGSLLEQRIRQIGPKACCIKVDVTDEREVAGLFDRSSAELGYIAGLVNCAGIDCSKTAISSLSLKELRHLFDVNVFGTMLCCSYATRIMSTIEGGRGGAIVNLSSMAATIGGRSGSAVYAASKSAVDTFTVGIAKEVARQGIRINSVRPGMTGTAMTEKLSENASMNMLEDVKSTIPLGRMALPDEIAHPIIWLLSDEASFVSGCRLDVSGGGFVIGSERVYSS